jgi:hypothetical protein
VYIAGWNFDGPQEKARGSARIVGVRAQRARCDAVDSKKRERTFVSFLI